MSYTTIRTDIPESAYRAIFGHDRPEAHEDTMDHDPSYPQLTPVRKFDEDIRKRLWQEVSFDLKAATISYAWPKGCFGKPPEPTRWERIKSRRYRLCSAVRRYFSNLWDAICGREGW